MSLKRSITSILFFAISLVLIVLVIKLEEHLNEEQAIMQEDHQIVLDHIKQVLPKFDTIINH